MSSSSSGAGVESGQASLQRGSETSLVIAVCVLGTLVGVGVLVVLGFILVRCDYCYCCDVGRWATRNCGKRRSRRSRSEIELEHLAASDNFISDSMLPGNRTGASENLGIRSPDPRRIPALRVPDDLSPSPPFPQEGQPVILKRSRDRLPSPRRGQQRTVLNTLVSRHSPEIHGKTRSNTDTFWANNSPKHKQNVFSRGVYSSVPTQSPTSRRQHGKRRRNAKDREAEDDCDGYPESERDTEDHGGEKCQDHSHRYYRPGGLTGYVRHHPFIQQSKRSTDRYCRDRSSNLYAQIPVSDDSQEGDANQVKGRTRMPRNKQREHPPTDDSDVEDVRNAGRCVQRSNDCNSMHSDTSASSTKLNAVPSRKQSPPIASSSRNTSVEYSSRAAESRIRHKQRLVRRKFDGKGEDEMFTVGSYMSMCRPAQPEQASGTGSDRLHRTGERSASELQSRDTELQTHRALRADPSSGHIICIAPTAASTATTALAMPGTVTYIQTSSGLVPSTSYVVPGATIHTVDREATGDTASFRTNNIATTNARGSHFHAGNSYAESRSNSGHACSVLTLRSLLDCRAGDSHTPSVLYQGSHHSSTQSLRPPSNILGGTLSFAGSRTMQAGMFKTPTEYSVLGMRKSNTDEKVTQDRRSSGASLNLCSKSHVQVQMLPELGSGSCRAAAGTSDSATDDHIQETEGAICLPPASPSQELPTAGSNTSSSARSSPRQLVSAAIQKCVPAFSKDEYPQNPARKTSFMDLQDVDPTTASMSWDHLTPDPSPVMNSDTIFPESHYTPNYRKQGHGQRASCHPLETSIPDSEFDDTFARHYQLKPYKKTEINSDVRVAANLNPAIEQEMVEKDPNDMRRQAWKKSHSVTFGNTEENSDCTSMEQTRHRQDVVVRPTNILQRYLQSESVLKPPTNCDESYSQSLLSALPKSSYDKPFQ